MGVSPTLNHSITITATNLCVSGTDCGFTPAFQTPSSLDEHWESFANEELPALEGESGEKGSGPRRNRHPERAVAPNERQLRDEGGEETWRCSIAMHI